MTSADSHVYHFAVLRVVPHVHRGEFVNIGVLLHARRTGFLGMRAITDPAALNSLVPDTDADRISRYLRVHDAICRGDPDAGPIATLPHSERFHWLSAPRSDLLQTSAVHEGISNDPARTLDELFTEFVGASALRDETPE